MHIQTPVYLFITINIIYTLAYMVMGFPGSASGKEPACQCRRHQRWWFNPWVRKILWRRAWQSTPVFLPGESHGQRSLAGYSPYYLKEQGAVESTECTYIGISECMCVHQHVCIVNMSLQRYLYSSPTQSIYLTPPTHLAYSLLCVIDSLSLIYFLICTSLIHQVISELLS